MHSRYKQNILRRTRRSVEDLAKKDAQEKPPQPVDFVHCIRGHCSLDAQRIPIGCKELFHDKKGGYFYARVQHPDSETKLSGESLQLLAQEFRDLLQKHDISAQSLRVVNMVDDMLQMYRKTVGKADKEKQREFRRGNNDCANVFELQISVPMDDMKKIPALEKELKAMIKESGNPKFMRSL